MKKEVKSAYQCMYLVSENVYSKLLDCIEEAQKDEITEMNSSFMKDNSNLQKQNTFIPIPSPATNSLSENTVIGKSLIPNEGEKNNTRMDKDETQQNTTQAFESFDNTEKTFYQSTPKPKENVVLDSVKSQGATKKQTPNVKFPKEDDFIEILDQDNQNQNQLFSPKNTATPKKRNLFEANKSQSEKSTKVKKNTANKSFETKEYQDNERSVRKKKTIEYKCIYCNKKFNNFQDLKSHIYENGHGKKNLPCKLCGKEVIKNDVIAHFNEHKDHFQQKGKGVKKRLLKNNKIRKPFCFYPEWCDL